MTENIYNSEFVKKLFNNMSSSYERMNFITSFGFSIRWRSQFIQHFKSTQENIEIIDLMTGMGETWKAVIRKFPNAQLSALDFSSEMLKQAQRKSKKYTLNGVKILNQDILQNTLPPDHYDLVICAFGLKTFDSTQLQILARETFRILKTGGKFSFIEVSTPENPVLKTLYRFYLGKIIPILGRLLLGNPTEYKMLGRYTDKFENAKVAMEIFRDTGLETKYHAYFYGCATGFSGSK